MSHDPIALFTCSVRRWPERVALVCDGMNFTYRELDRWSDAIAARVISAGHAAQRIAFVAEKSPSSYAAILGILKAGGSYVPLAPDAPPARWREMIAKAGVRCMLGATAELDALEQLPIPASEEASSLSPLAIEADAEAYVLFTSGSTGGPKGVSVSRANVAAYLRHVLAAYTFNEEDRFTQFFALTFDLSVHDLFVCWASGACACVPDANAALRAGTFVREHAITVWFSVPSVVTVMQRMRSLTSDALPSLRYAFFCGEALTWPLVDAFRQAAPRTRLINLYGPTEATIAITEHEIQNDGVPHEGIVPIGRPFDESRVMLHDEELWLAGPQLTNGYVNDPATTAGAFVDRDGVRWYRTGDRVVQDKDGLLHFTGRVDDQVKLLGHRVEPAEVDAVITPLLPSGTSITVPLISTTSTRLVTFIDVRVDTRTLLERCRAFLPAYMVPERIIIVEALPLTSHGKVDRKRLIEAATHG